MAKSMLLALSLDVEEEGLFSGRYATRNLSFRNTEALGLLESLCARGARPTLFCVHGAFTDTPTRDILNRLVTRHNVEIGAHLHHWNTPPLRSDSPHYLTRVGTAALSPTLLGAKLDSLLKTARDFLGYMPTSFRMGRWDLRKTHWPLLAERGILCDASVRPLHAGSTSEANPDHFDAPADPYWVRVGERKILEIPLTVRPMTRQLARMATPRARAALHHWGALALLPIQHPLWLMKLATLNHARQGGRVLSLTWHSSEMLPGGAPHVRARRNVEKFMAKIHAYLDWLERHFEPTHVTMSEIKNHITPIAPQNARADADWIWDSNPGPEDIRP